MKTLLILEHAEHLRMLKKEYNEGDVFIALTPSACYALEKHGFDYKTPEACYDHKEFFSLYKDCTLSLINTIIALERIATDIDKRFNGYFFKPFFLKAYQLKNAIDAIKIWIYLLKRVISKETPSRVAIVKSNWRPLNEEAGMDFHPRDPLCHAILSKLSVDFGFELKSIELNESHFLQEPDYLLKNFSDGILNLLKGALFSFGAKTTGTMKKKILSVGCREINVLKDAIEKSGYQVDTFAEEDFRDSGKGKSYSLFYNLTQEIESNAHLRELFSFESIEYYDLIKSRILNYCSDLENIFQKYLKLSDFVKQRGYDCVIVGIMSYALVNIMMTDICRNRRIPCICWMHGGYGAYASIEGYDMTDLLFGTEYFIYGRVIANTISEHHPVDTIGESNLEKINNNFSAGKVNLHVLGSPWMEKQYGAVTSPQNIKKTILLIMGELWVHNHYYMGGDTPYSFMQKWSQTKQILAILFKYLHRYDIIIKTYPSDKINAGMLKSFLKENSASAVHVIRDEISLEKLIKKSDLIISTWVSTTFFESAFVKADQFLFDDTPMTREARNLIRETCFYADKIDVFCFTLDNYLREGKFYQKSKGEFLNGFLDSTHKQERVNIVLNSLDEIIENYSRINKRK